LGELGNFQDIKVGLEGRKRVFELALTFRERTILQSETVFVDGAGLVEVIEAIALFL